MKRKIKFRGKRLDNGEWAYGAFVPDEDIVLMYNFCPECGQRMDWEEEE